MSVGLHGWRSPALLLAPNRNIDRHRIAIISGTHADEYSIFVPSSGSPAPTTDTAVTSDAAARILPILIRDLKRQLDEAGIAEDSDEWSFSYTWDGHGLFDNCQFVEQGFRFDAYVEVFADKRPGQSPREEVGTPRRCPGAHSC